MKFLFLLTAMGLVFAVPVTAGDLETSRQNLKQAVELRDAGLVKKFAAEAFALAKKTIATPAPKGDEAKADWAQQVAQAKELESYGESALFNTALQVKGEGLIDLIATLEKQNPKSKYLDGAYGPYFEALEEAGQGAKVQPIAEKAILSQPENEELLLVLADAAMAKRLSAKAAGYAEKLIAVMTKHPKPEGMSDADWEFKKNQALGHAYYTAGMVHSERQQFAQADQDLRAAVPLVKDEQALAAMYYHLGLANFNMGMSDGNKARILDGVKFSEQSAAIESPFKKPAQANVARMREMAGRLK